MLLIQKAFFFLKKYSFFDFLRKLICFLFKVFSFSFFRRIRGGFYLKNFSVRLGKNVRFIGLCNDVTLGHSVSIYDRVIFEFSESSTLCIGDNSVLSYGVLISCRTAIHIGENVQIGEYTSIRDSTHSYINLEVPMKFSPDISKKIYIGNDVWIGRGCIISPGTTIEDGVVVGANSVVKGYLKKNGIYAGAPIKYLKSRSD